MKAISKKELSLILSKLDLIREPKVLLEQYSTPPEIAADILFIAKEDIKNRVVADFGCGNGIFAIGAKILGAEYVYCLEIDQDAIEIAKMNCEKLGIDIKFFNMDVDKFNYNVDTVIENPPFGFQRRGADLPFIMKSLERSKTFYLLQSSEARSHIIKVIEGKGKLIMEKNYKFNLPYTFKFHKSEIRKMDVTLFVVKVIQ